MAEEEKKPKAKRPTAKKRDAQNAKRNVQNRVAKKEILTATKALRSEQDKTKAASLFNKVSSLLDKAVKRKFLKLNKVARDKSKLSKLLK
jgi:small subunit ribosomal protein S20